MIGTKPIDQKYPWTITHYKNTFRFIGRFFLTNTILFWCLGLVYLHAILSTSTLFNNIVANYSSPLGKCFVIFFVLINYLSYMMLLAFIPASLVVIFASVLPLKRFVMGISILIMTISIIFLISDTLTFTMFKFHLNSTLITYILSPEGHTFLDLSTQEVILLVSSLAMVLVLESCVAWLVWHQILLKTGFKSSVIIFLIWFIAALYSYGILMTSMSQGNNLFSQQIPNLPLYHQLFVHTLPFKNPHDILSQQSEQNFSQPLFPNEPLQYPMHPMRCRGSNKPYNIILIMVDSLRFDSLNAHSMPYTTELATHGWQFKNHFSGGNATQPGLFSLFYSIPSNYWTAALKQRKRSVLIDLLLNQGYVTQIIWSAQMQNPPFDKTIYIDLPNLSLSGQSDSDVGNRDRETTKRAIQFLSKPQQDKPFFLNLFYNAPHAFCSEQSFSKPFQPASENCNRFNFSNDEDPKPYYNRYLNAVKFIDDELNKIWITIRDKGYLENSIVIFTADHGQEFNDNQQNYWGHSGNFTRSQVHIPFFILWPHEHPREINYITSSYDFLPTIMTRHFACENPISDYSIGQPLLSEKNRLPFILAGSYINMGLIEPDRLTTIETSGRVNVTDTKAAPLPYAQPRMKKINQALAFMRQYFKASSPHWDSPPKQHRLSVYQKDHFQPRPESY